MKITRIKIENKLNIKHVEINFSRKNNVLVVGPNGWAERMLELCADVVRKKHKHRKPYSDGYVSVEKIPEVREFWNNVLPKLLDILAKGEENLEEFINSKTEADVEVLSASCSRINFMCIKLPDSSDEEFNVITSAFTEIFGDDVLLEHPAYEGLSENELEWGKEVTEGGEEEQEEENKHLDELSRCLDETDDEGIILEILTTIKIHAKKILNHSNFLRLAGFDSRLSNNGIYSAGFILRTSCLVDMMRYHEVPFADGDAEISANDTRHERIREILTEIRRINEISGKGTLGKVIEMFLKERSFCVLPQKPEQNTSFWSMAKAEEKFINAWLSTGDKTMLENFEEAMAVISRLKLTTTQDNDGKLIAKFQNCGDTDWRELHEASDGERELILVLSAIHLSGADNVFLDEPGHSLHPPMQAQVRRWLEQRKGNNQALFVITHSSDMVSSDWLEGLYHMYSDDKHYSAASLKGVVSHESECSEPPRKKRKFYGNYNKSKLDSNLREFLMTVEMRRLFFSSGTIFVEGDSDKRVIEMLRAVELDRLRQSNKYEVSDMTSAFWWGTQIDQWDIISLGGCANWLKAYQAATDLKVPFVIVLDADVLNNISGSSIVPITYESWNNSRLRKAIKNSGNLNDDAHPLAQMMKNIDQITASKSEQNCSQESDVRDELKKCNIWVWNNADIESVLFEDEEFRNVLYDDEDFRNVLKGIDLSIPDEPSISGLSDSGLKVKSTRVCDFRSNAVSAELGSGVQKVVIEDEQNPPGVDAVEGIVSIPEESSKREFGVVTSISHIYDRFKASCDELDHTFNEIVSQVRTNSQDVSAVDKLVTAVTTNAGRLKQDLNNFKKCVKRREEKKAGKESTRNTKDFFYQLKKKLHDEGHWKTISSHELQRWISKALEVNEDHPFHLLWEYIRELMKYGRKDPDLPSHIMRKFFQSCVKTSA